MLLLEKLEQRKKYIFSIMIICIIIGAIYSCFGIQKRSTSESILMLIEKEEKSENDFTNKGNLVLTKKMVSNFEEIIKSDSSIKLLNESLKTNMNTDELKNQIQVKINSNSDTFKIIVENKNLDLSLKINKELIKVFSKKLKTIYTNTEVYIVDNARIEESINYISIIKVMILSIVLGVIINAIYIISVIEVDKKVKRTNDLESEFALKNLGNIPINKSKNKLINKEKNTFVTAFKELRSNIQFINVNNKEKNILLVTSPKKQEGKSIVASNIAISFAKTGKKVVLIDADMNTGKIDKLFNIPNDLGLSNYLSGIDENGVDINERINKFIKDTPVKNLNVITSGTIPPNSSELLSMPKFEETIKDLSVFYDFVILDATSVLNETDALILTRLANSTIIVCNYKKTKRDDLWRAKRDIQNVGGRIIGTVINKVKIKEDTSKKYNDLKQLMKDKYSKIRDYIITKRDNRKQKLLDAAIIEEKQKVVQGLKIEENKLIEEIEKEKSIEKPKLEEQEVKNNIFTAVASNLKQMVIKEKSEKQEQVEEKEVVLPKEELSKTVSAPVVEKLKEEKIELEETKTIEQEKSKVFDTSKVKENLISFGKAVKEKTFNATSKVNEMIKKEKAKLEEIKKESAEKKIEKDKEEVAKEKIKESKEIIRENSEKIMMEHAINELETEVLKAEKDENSVLVIVDAENGYCRAFSQYCFTEKLIRGIDKTDGFVKANYSTAVQNRKRASLVSKYELTKKQLDRIDTLVYTVLKEYDDCVWLERKMISNKADDYVLCMSKEYEKSENETKPNYELRCQYLRKVELAKAQIEIEYKLDNLWNSNQITFTDKVIFYNFAKKYENLKEKKKTEERENKSKEKVGLKNPLNILKKIKIDEVKVKTVEELAKEVEEYQNQNDYENYQFEDYDNYQNYSAFNSKLTEQEIEEQKIKQEQEEMVLEQIRLKQELKDQKNFEKAQKKEERIKRREEKRKSKELKKQKAKEEARIEEELLVDNLYPKTKYNKNL